MTLQPAFTLAVQDAQHSFSSPAESDERAGG